MPTMTLRFQKLSSIAELREGHCLLSLGKFFGVLPGCDAPRVEPTKKILKSENENTYFGGTGGSSGDGERGILSDFRLGRLIRGHREKERKEKEERGREM